MRLLTVGDSFTYGEELNNLDDAWPHLLGKRIGYEVTNLAKPGTGNTQMIRTVVNNAATHDLIIVAWSHWARTEFADEDGIFDIWPGCNTEFYTNHPWRKELVNYYTKHHNDSYLAEQFLINIVLLQSYLRSINKRYIMLTAFGVDLLDQLNTDNQLNLQLVDNTHYIGWPGESMMEWAWRTPKGPRGHFLELGHIRVSEKIYEHIRNLSWVS